MVDITLEHCVQQIVNNPTSDINVLDLCFSIDQPIVEVAIISGVISDQNDLIVLNDFIKNNNLDTVWSQFSKILYVNLCMHPCKGENM